MRCAALPIPAKMQRKPVAVNSLNAEDYIRQQIRSHGPVDVGTFMALALSHPEGGYYTGADPLGATGDFTTAPEISQLFGEMIGAWCADLWIRMGRPAPFILAECGPGRGTLMADLLRATKAVPGFHKAAQIHLVEISPGLREKQRSALADYQVTWHDDCQSLPDHAPLLLIANEFLDALPIRQYQKTAQGWAERVIGLDGQGRFIFGLVPAAIRPPIEAQEGDIFELAPAREAFTADLAARIISQSGAALLIDYGHETSAAGDTLQAVKDHAPVDVLAAPPGSADITSHVDFAALARIAAEQSVVVHGPVPQGAFLQALGIGLRAAMLERGAQAGQQDALAAGLARLTAPDQMGQLFKVMALCHDKTITPVGF